MATATQGKFVDRVKKIAPNNNNGILSRLVTTVTGSVYNVSHVSGSATSFIIAKGNGYKITPELGGGSITQGLVTGSMYHISLAQASASSTTAIHLFR